MLFFITIIITFSSIVAYNPSCISYKHFIPYYLGNQDFSLCKMFKNISYNKGIKKIMHNYAIHYENDANLHGKSCYLHDVDYNNKIIKQLELDFNELNNRCCGEVNEKDEIEQLEKDFLEIFQEIKNCNNKSFLLQQLGCKNFCQPKSCNI
jgi:hypothetical protein